MDRSKDQYLTVSIGVGSYQSDGSYKKTFNDNGVNVVIKIRPIQGV